METDGKLLGPTGLKDVFAQTLNYMGELGSRNFIMDTSFPGKPEVAEFPPCCCQKCFVPIREYSRTVANGRTRRLIGKTCRLLGQHLAKMQLASNVLDLWYMFST